MARLTAAATVAGATTEVGVASGDPAGKPGLNPIMVLRAGSYTQQGNQGYAVRYKSPAKDKWHSWLKELSPGDSNEN
jgi:hypothetical protein